MIAGAVLGWTDSDGQANPKSVLAVFAAVRDGIAMGVPSRDSRGAGLWRAVQSNLYNGLFRVLFRVPFTDINAPPKFPNYEICS